MLRLLPLVFMFAIVASVAWTQNDLCDPKAALPATDPAHAEAMKLSKTLNRHGIQIRCVLLSKEAQLFDGQLGAALFRTEIGDFEALFLPPTQADGESMPVAWNHLYPQIPGAAHGEAPECIFFAGRGAVMLLGYSVER